MIPLLVAHRGYMEKYPENSLSSIRAALDAGACMIEFDVQMNADAQLLLLHDDNFKRTAGVAESVFKLGDYSNVSVHEPERFAQTFKPEAVPMLAQVMEILLEYPDATAFVEIKDESLQHWGTETMMDKVLACIEQAKQQCVIISDNLDALLCVKTESDIPVGWVIHRYDSAHHQLAEKHVPDFLICNYRRINSDLWQGGWQWMLYDISDPELAMKWSQKGAQLIETRDIGGMLQHPLLQSRACQPR